MTENNSQVCSMLSLKKTAKMLKRNNNFIIITHASPDGDTLGAGFALFYALKMFNKRVAVICPDPIPEKYRYFVSNTDMVNDEGAFVMAVDIADKSLFGSFEDRYGDRVELCIDHHISNTKYAKNLYLDAEASATCEIIYELLGVMGVKLNDIIAKALYTGISTDTGCFKYQNVTSKTLRIAAGLYEYNIKADEINRIMFDTKSRRLLELERMVLDTAEYHFDNKCMVLTVTDKMQKKTGCSGTDLETLATLSRNVEGVICGVTIKQTGEETYKVSFRTYNPLNASEIGNKLGGGGHKAAAGATVTGDLKEVKAKILGVIGEAMEQANVGTVADK